MSLDEATAVNRMGLHACPSEILVKIFLGLPASAKLALRATCQHLATIFYTSSAIQYDLRLEAWGMEECAPWEDVAPTLPHVDRLRRLQQQISNFSHLKWSKSEMYSRLNIPQSTLAGNQLWCLSWSGYYEDGQAELGIYNLPSAGDGNMSILEVAIQALPFKAKKMEVDVSQDLVVFVETYVPHFRRRSSSYHFSENAESTSIPNRLETRESAMDTVLGRVGPPLEIVLHLQTLRLDPHPEAIRSSEMHTIGPGMIEYMQVAENLVGILCVSSLGNNWTAPGDLTVIDWKTGLAVLRGVQCSSFSLLNGEAFITQTHGDGEGLPETIALWKRHNDGSFHSDVTFAMPRIPVGASAQATIFSVLPPGLARKYSHRTEPGRSGRVESINGSASDDAVEAESSARQIFRGNSKMDSFVQIMYLVRPANPKGSTSYFTILVDVARALLSINWKNLGYSSQNSVPYDLWSCPPTDSEARSGEHGAPRKRAVVVIDETSRGGHVGILYDIAGGRFARIINRSGFANPFLPNTPSQGTSSIEVFDMLLARGSDPIASYDPAGSELPAPRFPLITGADPALDIPHNTLVRADWVERPPFSETGYIFKGCRCGVQAKNLFRTSDTQLSSVAMKSHLQMVEDEAQLGCVIPGDHAEVDLASSFTDNPHWDDFKHQGMMVRRVEKDLGCLVKNDALSRVMMDDQRIVFVRKLNMGTSIVVFAM